MREFKDILLELRNNRNLTQDQLASALGITKQALSHYERGTRYPKKEMLCAIADYFNVDMNYLTGRSNVTSRLLNSVEIELIDSYRQNPAAVSPASNTSSNLTMEEDAILSAYRKAPDLTKDAVANVLGVKRAGSGSGSAINNVG